MHNHYESPSLEKVANVAAVVVTYNPSIEMLLRLLKATSTQVGRILVVDNGSDDAERVVRMVSTISNAEFTGLRKNMGIAYAQNVGILIAYRYGVDFVLTLDQDSVPDHDMVKKLFAVFNQLQGSERIAAVGPLLLDESTQLPLPFFSYRNGRKERTIPTAGSEILNVECLVSSGTLLSMSAIVEVGLMREELFISYVDVEWCLRARSHGFQVLGCCAATMTHNLGERRLKIGRYLIPLHSPLRHYYVFRSGIYMQRLSNISAVWKRADRRQLARSFVLFGIVGLPKIQEFTAMCRGLKDGLSMSIQPAMRLQTTKSYREGVMSSPADDQSIQSSPMSK
jgi:rhamnosyltransferase